jgi:hypothetical protein
MDPRLARVLDGELAPDELPPELRAEALAALRVLAVADRATPRLAAGFDARVMAAVRARAEYGAVGWRQRLGERARRWLVEPWQITVRLRPWAVGAALAAAALAFVLLRPTADTPVAVAAPDSVAVRFVLYAPDARQVSVAGTFNQWDRGAAPLVPAPGGVWSVTLLLPAGEHQYTFVVDGERWVADPAAPAVDDGFGRTNSVLAVGRGEGRSL